MVHTDTYKAVRHVAYKPRARAVLSSFKRSRLRPNFKSRYCANLVRENH